MGKWIRRMKFKIHVSTADEDVVDSRIQRTLVSIDANQSARRLSAIHPKRNGD